jgi:inner membrane protein
VRGSSHVVFGLAGAVVVDGIFQLSGPRLLDPHVAVTADLVAQKLVFYGFAGLGALVPDIDNARSTLGKRLGIISKGIQHFAGHRTIFHSILGLVLTGAVIWLAQFGLGYLLLQFGLTGAAHDLNVGLAPNEWVASGAGLGFVGLLVGYFLHLVADSLTEGGVPWLFPSRVRYGFPPDRHWRFKTGTIAEPIVVVTLGVLVVVAAWARILPV